MHKISKHLEILSVKIGKEVYKIVQTTRPCFPINARDAELYRERRWKQKSYFSSYLIQRRLTSEGRRIRVFQVEVARSATLDSTPTVVERRLVATSTERRAICSAYTSTRERAASTDDWSRCRGSRHPCSGRGRRRRRCVARLREAGANPRRHGERSGGAPVTWRRGS